MMELSTLPFPICFDVDGLAGEAYCLLRDPTIGTMVAGTISSLFYVNNGYM